MKRDGARHCPEKQARPLRKTSCEPCEISFAQRLPPLHTPPSPGLAYSTAVGHQSIGRPRGLPGPVPLRKGPDGARRRHRPLPSSTPLCTQAEEPLFRKPCAIRITSCPRSTPGQACAARPGQAATRHASGTWGRSRRPPDRLIASRHDGFFSAIYTVDSQPAECSTSAICRVAARPGAWT